MHDWLIAGLALVALAALAVALRERSRRTALERWVSTLDQRFGGYMSQTQATLYLSDNISVLHADVDQKIHSGLEKIGKFLNKLDDLEKLVECRRKDFVGLSQSCSTWYAENHAMHKKHDAAFQEFLLSSGMTREVAPAIPEEQILVVKGAVPEHDTFRKLTAAEKESAAKRWARTVTEKSLGGNQPIQKGAAA